MTVAKLNEMTRGWFVGDFSPTAFATAGCEVGVKEYKAGDREPRHHHKIATEITLILDGEVTMNGTVFRAGDIVTVSPNESVEFVALTDARNVVVKTPCILGDKYLD
jgi:quercetin dioxygenase-like cupin family protein